MADGREERDGDQPFDIDPEIPLGELEARVERGDMPAVSEEELALEALDAFALVKRAIEEDRYTDAENLLDAFEERGGEWYYQRAMLCKKRSWFLESLRNMKEAVRLDPENELYQQELEELDKMATPDGEEGKKDKKRKKHMGGSKVDWSDACGEGCGACCSGICQGICESGC